MHHFVYVRGLSHSVMSDSLQLMDCSLPGSIVHGTDNYFPVKNAAFGCHIFLQGILLTQGSNMHLLCLLHWQEGSLALAPPEEPQTAFYWITKQFHT